MKADRYWWTKVVALILALAGVVWAQCSLQESIEKPQSGQTQEIESIPAKVEIGK